LLLEQEILRDHRSHTAGTTQLRQARWSSVSRPTVIREAA